MISAALDPFLATILWPWVLLWCHAFAVVPWVPNNAPDDAIQAVLMMRRSSPRAPPGPCRSESLRFQPHISKGARDTTAQHRQRRALRSLLHRMGTHQGPQWDTPRVYPKPGHFTACAQFNPPRYSQKIDRVGPNSTSARTNARAERPPAAAHTPAFWAHVISTAATRGCIRLSLRSTHPASRRRRPSAPTTLLRANNYTWKSRHSSANRSGSITRQDRASSKRPCHQ